MMTRELFAATAPIHDAVLDEAHRGDIKGAFGTVLSTDRAGRRSTWARLRTLLTIMGPGLIVMVGDNDAGGIATYTQAGQNVGTSLLWVLLLLIPVLIVNQEMVVRLGLVTGVGHARLINERFGRFWGAFSVGDLFVLNFLTIVTEFIGVNLSLSYFGVSSYLSVPLAALLLIAMTVSGSFRRWERIMYLFVVFNFLAVPLAFMSHPHIEPIARGFLTLHVQGGLSSSTILLIIGIVGTTVAPWQLFFQQSNVIDKRLTPRWMAYERADTVIGAIVTILGAACLIVATAFAFGGTPLSGAFTDAGAVAQGLRHTVGVHAGAVFALLLLNASLIGASAVTLSTSYAFGDMFGLAHSLHRSWRDARGFYALYALLIIAAAGIVLLPNAPLGLITEAVQALAGVLLPSATVFLLLLCNDRAVLGPWVNRPWLNIVGSLIVGVLVMLSLILAATTLFPTLDVGHLSAGLAAALVAVLLGCGVLWLRRPQSRASHTLPPVGGRETWRMPPLADLPPATLTSLQRVGLLGLRVYLVVAAGLLIVKVVQVALAH